MVVAPSTDLYKCWNGHLFRATMCPACGQRAEDCERMERHEAMRSLRAMSEVEKQESAEKAREKAVEYRPNIWRVDCHILKPLFEDYLEKHTRKILHQVTGLTFNKIDNILERPGRRQEVTRRVLEKLENLTGLSRGQFALQKGLVKSEQDK